MTLVDIAIWVELVSQVNHVEHNVLKCLQISLTLRTTTIQVIVTHIY